MHLDMKATPTRFLAPEVVQTSVMDCGPATLKCLLEGFGIPAHYERLRDVCHAGVDGTSIDTLEDMAIQLGLQAEQTMVPVDHLLLSESRTLPALVVTVLPNGATHFVVVWRCHGPVVQVMDPATGRRWPSRQRFLSDVYHHSQPMSAAAWRTWAGSPGFVLPLRQRLARLGLETSESDRLIDFAREDTGWKALAALDASTRLVSTVVEARGLTRGTEAAALVRRYVEPIEPSDRDVSETIPATFWSVQPLPPPQSTAPSPDDGVDESLVFKGALLLRVHGRRPPLRPQPSTRRRTHASQTTETTTEDAPTTPNMAPGLAAVLAEGPSRPERDIWNALRDDGLLTPSVLALALILAAFGVTIEAVLLRGLMALSQQLGVEALRFQLLGSMCLLMGLLLLLELPIAATTWRLGRRLETRLRLAFLKKVPRLGERYFQSRLTSDIVQRAHDLRQLRTIPILASRGLRLGCQILLTSAGMIWLAPASAPVIGLALLWALGLSIAIHPLLAERDMRVRTHVGALSRFYLDALLGLVPIRTHGAERALQHEHEPLLVAWARAHLAAARVNVMTQSAGALISSGFAIWIVLANLNRDGSSTMLLLYWALSLPLLGQQMVECAQLYTTQRNRAQRLLEPLGAPDEEHVPDGESIANRPRASPPATGVAIEMHDVTVDASGNTLLHPLNINLQPGEHVAIVGPSGAGKSTLAALLLGWQQPTTGRLLVDGEPLDGGRLHALRLATAWVDPAVQLWNRSLLDNLHYGTRPSTQNANLGQALEEADLLDILERLPKGLQTHLGEGGGLVSGGEGQRVRFGRALMRSNIRLVILDEPFRGQDRDKRRQLLAAARRYWHHATLICITHDVSETQGFARVLVIENGHLVEDGTPTALQAQTGSRYRTLLTAEETARDEIWQGPYWHRLWIEAGRLRER